MMKHQFMPYRKKAWQAEPVHLLASKVLVLVLVQVLLGYRLYPGRHPTLICYIVALKL